MYKLIIILLIITLIPLGIIAGTDKKVANKTETPLVESILSRYIDAVGGSEALLKLSNRTCTGKQITDLTSRENPSYESLKFKMYAQIPNKCMIEYNSENKSYKEGFDGETGWISDNAGLRVDDNAGRNKIHFLLNPQGPLMVEKYFPNLIYEGITEINNTKVQALKPADLPPEHYTLYFDIETGLLVSIGQYWTLGDFRPIDGVFVPYRINTSRKGGSTVYEFENITHNTEMPENIFNMPK